MATAVVLSPPTLPADSGAPVLDNLQDLLRRKREIEKNKSKYHLTESDCSLILTNANEYTFTDGQVILEEGHENSSVYRIKSGIVALSKNGNTFCELTQGWFIGETLFLDNKKSDIIEASLIAKGTVTLCEILALKFYRNLASKLSSIFFAIAGNLMTPCIAKVCQVDNSLSSFEASSLSPSSPKLAHSHSTSSSSSSSSAENNQRRFSHSSSSGSVTSLSSSSSPSPAVIKCSKTTQAEVEVANRRRRLSKRRSISLAHTAFKVYTLETDGKGVRTCRLKNRKIKVITEAFGFKHKTTIHFAKIRNVVRTSGTSVTIIFDPLKAKTLFFKATADLEEFYGLTNSLVETSNKLLQKTTPSSPLSYVSLPDSPALNPLKFSSDNHFLPLDARDDAEQRALDKEIIVGLATRLELKRGDVLFEEGDLYQRIYTVTRGTCETVRAGRIISTIKEGEVFGEATLLHLRPAPVTMRISSETASILVIPAYKLQELINSNPVLAVRIYKKTASLVEKKIDAVLSKKHEIASEMCSDFVTANYPTRLNL